MPQLTLHPAKPADISLAATLIARTYTDQGAKMIEMTGQLRGLPDMKDEYGVLIADDREEAVGYALFTPVGVGSAQKAAALLAPLAYDTGRDDLNPNDILKMALAYAQEKGFRYVLMHGDLAACAPLGFEDAENHSVTSAVRYADTILLLKDFGQGAPESISGDVVYPPFVQ